MIAMKRLRTRIALAAGIATLGTLLGLLLFSAEPHVPLLTDAYDPADLLCKGVTTKRCAELAADRLSSPVAWISPRGDIESYLFAIEDGRGTQELASEDVLVSVHTNFPAQLHGGKHVRTVELHGVEAKVFLGDPKGSWFLEIRWERSNVDYLLDVSPRRDENPPPADVAFALRLARAIRYELPS